MDPYIFMGFFTPILILLAILIGMKMHYRHLENTRLSGSAHQEGEHLADAVENLRTEFELLRSEVLELNERVEFTERLLERPKTEE